MSEPRMLRSAPEHAPSPVKDKSAAVEKQKNEFDRWNVTEGQEVELFIRGKLRPAIITGAGPRGFTITLKEPVGDVEDFRMHPRVQSFEDFYRHNDLKLPEAKSEPISKVEPVAQTKPERAEPAKDFTDAKKKILRKQMNPDREKVLADAGLQLLQPIEVKIRQQGRRARWVGGGYIVGVVEQGGKPMIAVSKPSPDGSHFDGGEPLFIPIAAAKTRLRATYAGAAAGGSVPPKKPTKSENAVVVDIEGGKPATAEQSAVPPIPPQPPEVIPDADILPPDDAHRARLQRMRRRLEGLHTGEKIELKVGITDITPYIEQISHRIAEEKVREYMNQKGFKKLLGGLMHLSEDGYRRAFYNEAMDAITSNRNLMTQIEARVFGRGNTTVTAEGQDRTLQILDEIMRGMNEDLIHPEQKGEKFVGDAALNAATSELFVQYALGQISDRTAFDQRVELDIIPLLRGRDFSSKNNPEKNAASQRENLMHASNLWNLAEAFKDQLKELHQEQVAEHGEQNSEHIKNYLKGVLHLDVQLAKHARDIVNRAPEGKLKWFEKFSPFVQNFTPFAPINKALGWTIGNPVLHGIVGAMAARAGVRWGATGLATISLAAVAAPAGLAITGVLAGAATAGLLGKWRASKELKQDRGMVQRDAALGLKSGGPRSEKMHEYVQQMEDAETILRNLRHIAVNEQDPERRNAAFNVIADIRARLEIERHNMIDMIKVSAEEGKSFNSRIFSLHEIQRELKRLNPLMTDEAELRKRIDARKESLLNAMAAQDAEFEKFRTKESNRRALVGAAWGLVGATVMAGARELFPNGPFEHVVKKVGTAAKSLWSYLAGGEEMPVQTVLSNGVALPATRLQEVPFANGTLRLPENRVFLADADGSAVIATTDGRALTPKFHVGSDGKIDAAAQEMLAENGIHIEHAEQIVPGEEFSDRLQPWRLQNHALTQQFEFPENMNLVQNADGTFDIYNKSGKLIESGLLTNKDGVFNEHSMEMLRQHGWKVDQGMSIAQQAMSKGELGQYLREHFGQSKAHRLDWHGNGTPMHKVGGHWIVTKDGMNGSIKTFTEPHPPAGNGWNVKHVGGRWMGADGKELMLRLQGDAKDRVLSLKEMINTAVAGKVNPDLSVDHKFADIEDAVYKKEFADAAKNFRLRVFVGDNYWNSGESFELPVGPDGELHLKPGDELYNVLYDEQGNLKATVEAVIPDADGKGYHTLATAVRHGDGAGIVAHKAAYIHMTHPQTDTVRHFYSYDEIPSNGGYPGPGPIPGPGPHPLPPTPNFYDENPLIFPFPTPFFRRKAMEMPKDGEDRMSARLRTPVGRPPFRTNQEAAQEIVRGFGGTKRRPEQEPVRPPVRENVITVDGREIVLTPEEYRILTRAIESYANKEGWRLDGHMHTVLMQRFYKFMIAERAKPTDWKKPVVIRSGHDFKDQMMDAEQRMLVAQQRPEQITFEVPDAYFEAKKIAEKDRVGFIHIYESMAITTFAGYDVTRVRVVRENKQEDSGSGSSEREYPVLALREKIARVRIEHINDSEEFSSESFKRAELDRLTRAATNGDVVAPVVYVLDQSYIDRIHKKRPELDVREFFETNIRKLIAAVQEKTNIHIPYEIMVAPKKQAAIGVTARNLESRAREQLYATQLNRSLRDKPVVSRATQEAIRSGELKMEY